MFNRRTPSLPARDPLAPFRATSTSENRITNTRRAGRTPPERRIGRPATPLRPRQRLLPWFIALISGLLLLAVIFIFTTGHGKFSLASLLGSAAHNLLARQLPLKGQDRGRTNFLIYGMTKDGLRTDSIILVSYYWKEKKLVSLNIPRDLYVYDGYENAKMGEVYAYAKTRKPRDATYPDINLTDIIAKEYGVPIDYWAEFNMKGEVDIIDAIDGINIDVQNSFTDYQYPKWDYSGYIRPAPHFATGQQPMNGERALVFSRSRHSLDNNEGSDFARSKRQAIVIQGVITKLKAMGVTGNIVEISKYLKIIGDNLTTNMSTDEMVGFASTVKAINPQADYAKAAWETGNGFLIDGTNQGGAYVTLYGAPGVKGIGAGGYHDSKYRQMAIYFVQNLLASAPQAPVEFVATASKALNYLPSSTTNASP